MRNDKAANDNGTHHIKVINDVSSASQRAQILDYLQRNGSATTLDIRNELHILSPAPRVLELRERGHNINTVWVNCATPDGKKHRIAKYVLSSSKPFDDAA
ncbi:helix-turn-helix domain-containing protein [Thalassotalea montiporae]